MKNQQKTSKVGRKGEELLTIKTAGIFFNFVDTYSRLRNSLHEGGVFRRREGDKGGYERKKLAHKYGRAKEHVTVVSIGIKAVTADSRCCTQRGGRTKSQGKEKKGGKGKRVATRIRRLKDVYGNTRGPPTQKKVNGTHVRALEKEGRTEETGKPTTLPFTRH